VIVKIFSESTVTLEYFVFVIRDLVKFCPIYVDQLTFDDSLIKAHLLFQAHVSRLKLPITYYETDLKSVLDQAIRILQVIFLATVYLTGYNCTLNV